MPPPHSKVSRRGLAAVLVAVAVVLLLADLARPDSLVRAVWRELVGGSNPVRSFLDGMRERGPGRIFQR